MRVVHDKPVALSIKDISYGEAFAFAEEVPVDHVYIKVHEIMGYSRVAIGTSKDPDINVNAINVLTGEFAHFDKCTAVKRVQAELHLLAVEGGK